MRNFFGRFRFVLLLVSSMILTASAEAGTCCVWRITNVNQPFYLVGTIHALSGNDYPLPKGYDEALKNSQRLIFEITPDRKSDFGDKFELAATYPKGDDIRKHIHPKTWQFLAMNFKESQYFGNLWRFGKHHIEGVEQLRPWAIAFYVWGIHGYNDVFDEHGVDNHLAYQARRLGKEVGGLETNDEHIKVLSGMSDIESELILLDALTRGDKRRDDFNQMRAAWKKGDTATMWQLHQRERKLNAGGDARLLDMRNVKWIPRIKSEINSGKPTAIVAGSAHFIGYNGVVTLLEHQGYKIEQL